MKKNNYLKTEKTAGIYSLAFLINVILLSFFGAIMIFSAGGSYAYARYGDAYYFIKKQVIWVTLGLVVMWFSSWIPTSFIKKATPFFYAATLLLLILVLIIGFVGNGAKRWISIGPLTIQPSELAKLAIILSLSLYFSRKEEKIIEKTKFNILIFDTLLPLSIVLIPLLLVMLQKHLSCIIILAVIGVCMIVCAGANLKYIYGFGALGIGGISFLALFTDYTKERIMVWRNPEQYKLTGGWQTLQGLMAIGSGGFWGKGFGNSVMKHCYVSEPANDMIFAILCEEFGMFGALIALGLFATLVFNGVKISLKASDSFSKLLGLGICFKMAIQVLLNVAVVTNTIPNTGISLPFFSYGGSSLIMLFFEMGIILSISRRSRAKK